MCVPELVVLHFLGLPGAISLEPVYRFQAYGARETKEVEHHEFWHTHTQLHSLTHRHRHTVTETEEETETQTHSHTHTQRERERETKKV